MCPHRVGLICQHKACARRQTLSLQRASGEERGQANGGPHRPYGTQHPQGTPSSVIISVMHYRDCTLADDAALVPGDNELPLYSSRGGGPFDLLHKTCSRPAGPSTSVGTQPGPIPRCASVARQMKRRGAAVQVAEAAVPGTALLASNVW
jgi:hypothetical protein